MTETADELLPCPFCGGTDLNRSQTHGIICQGCHTQVLGSGTGGDVQTWNRRAADPRLQAAEHALKPFAAEAAELAEGIADDCLYHIEGHPDLELSEFDVGEKS